MRYKDSINFLYTQLPMFSKIGEKAIKKDLANTIKLCAFLGNPHKKIKTIHIAGTNGKGSTAHGLASIFQAQGYKTGLYTSPHIIDFRERIKINGQLCSKKYVVEITQKLMPIIEEIQPSFFEITVAMAFHYFAQKKVDIAIIETGLGGRLDSTNIIHPELSVITNISYDHQSILGNTLTEIAREKAGIIKKNTPVVIGRKNAETDKVFIETSKQQNAKLFFSEDTTKLIESKQNNKYNKVRYAIKSKERKIKSDLSGKYQVENIQTILSSIDIYNRNAKNKIKQKNIEQGLSNVCTNTKLLARWQCIGKNPKTIIDVAHNEDGINHALEQLKNEQYNHLHIIYSAVKDKDIDKILPLLPKDATYYFTEAKIERKLDANILLESAKKHQLNGNAFTEPQNALQQAKKASKNNDLILIIGSFFILEDILSKKS